MQYGWVARAVALLVLSLAPGADAAGFLAPRHASLVGKAVARDEKDMPVAKHDKDAGGDYNEGSPLYEKQEKLKASGDAKDPRAIKGNGAVLDVDGVKKHVPKVPKSGNADVDDLHSKLFNYQVSTEGHLSRGISAFVSYFLITMLVALIWTRCTSPGRTRTGYDERKNTGKSFAYGLFSLDHCAGHHSSVCLCSWCCSPLRIADTWAKEPFPLIKSFWVALIFVASLIGLSNLTFGLTSVLFLCAAIYYRQQLRRQYGMDFGGATCFQDCLVWWCCPCCAMAQEARQVEFVQKKDAPIK